MAQWRLIEQVAQGGYHLDTGLPCQDRALIRDFGSAKVLAVADGHGNRRHFRSEIGAQTACETAVDLICTMLGKIDSSDASLEKEVIKLKQDIVNEWRARIESYDLVHLFSDEEKLEADKHPDDGVLIPYGTTLLAAVILENVWFGIQLGDGMMVTISENGEYEWPMPESAVNSGNRTASLCMKNPLVDFQHVISQNMPAGLILSSDGIEKAFPVQGEKVISFLHWMAQAAHKEDETEANEMIAHAVRNTADKSKVRDDVSIAIAADLEKKLADPKLTQCQMEKLHQQQVAQARELQTVLDYTIRKMENAADEREWNALNDILIHNLDELSKYAPVLSEDEIQQFSGICKYEEYKTLTYRDQRNSGTQILGAPVSNKNSLDDVDNIVLNKDDHEEEMADSETKHLDESKDESMDRVIPDVNQSKAAEAEHEGKDPAVSREKVGEAQCRETDTRKVDCNKPILPVENARDEIAGEDSSTSDVPKPVEPNIEPPKINGVGKKTIESDHTGVKRKDIIKALPILVVALTVFAILSVTYLIPSQKYKQAEQKREIGQYDEAIKLFAELGDFNDAQTQVYATYYEKGEKVRSTDRPAALEAYVNAESYKDANAKLDALKEEIYQNAILLYQSGDWEEALAEFSSIPGYNDADTKAIQCDNEIRFAIGKYITFGTYPQTSDGTDSMPIEWLVLERDGLKALLISRYALDYQPYNIRYDDTTWETCTLRKWLNCDFVNKAFTTQQQAAIMPTNVDNSKNQGYYDSNGNINTQDKIFLLSYAEAWEYFNNDDARKCQFTAYAGNQSAYSYNGWWLRSSGNYLRCALVIFYDGSRDCPTTVNSVRGVRPALWVDLELSK